MRLTLRTLLAYMDDILDPADHEELGRKIEASDFATELIHRSRDAARRLKLGAPDPAVDSGGDLHGGNDELDANTMAEYLDNTLAPEAVAEFERACLAPGNQGDMLLAEAVSCHHVLAMVLREPAEVDRDLRRRLYDLAHPAASAGQTLRIEPAHPVPGASPEAAAAADVAAATAPITPAAAPAPATVSPREAEPHELPGYLRAAAETRRKKQRIMYVAIAAMVAGGIVAWAWPTEQVPPKEVAQLDKRMAGGVETGALPVREQNADDGGETELESGGEAPPFVPGAAGDDELGDEETAALPPASDDPQNETAASADNDVGLDVGDNELAPDDLSAPRDATAPPVDTGGTSQIPLGPLDENDAPIDDEPTAPAETPADSDAMAASAGPTAPRLGDEPPPLPVEETPVADPQTAPTAPADASEASATPTAETGPRPLGAYLGMMGTYDMLLAYNPEARQWQRLAPRTPLGNDVQLLALPTFRTMVNLRDANIYLAGGAEMVVSEPAALPGDPAPDFTLTIPRGRLIINAGLNGNRLELIVGDRSYVVELEPSSTLAVEVRGNFQPGMDVTGEMPARTIAWYLTTGSGKLAGDSGERSLTAPTQWTTTSEDGVAPQAISELPTWIDHEVLTDNERRAQKEIAPALAPGAPVNIALLELNDPDAAGRRREVRTLAAECAAYVGLFEPLVKALGDADQRAYWKRLIATMRQTLAEDPNAAGALEEALVALRGERDAATLMEMIVGYSPEDVGSTPEAIQSGPVAQVLRNLDSEDLDFRVLAFHNLCELTGTTGFGYRPEQTAEQRTRTLRIIWNRFEQGDLLLQQSQQ